MATDQAVCEQFDRETVAGVATERLEAAVQTLAARLAAATCEWLVMIAELDRRRAWESWECRSMAQWLSWKCAVSIRTGREHVRVARTLEQLPLVAGEFAAGRLSYSKVRALTRIVNASETEAECVALALAATASQLDPIAAGCDRVRRNNDPGREQRNHDRRRWDLVLDDDGMGKITMYGPADLLAEVKTAVDAAVAKQQIPETTIEPVNAAEPLAARRFDAAIAIAHHALAPDPEARPPATILIRVEASGSDANEIDLSAPIRAHGVSISRAAYERLRCDAAVAVERALDDGTVERTPTTDAIPRRVRRAVMNRDLHECRWAGCHSRTSLHVHHIVWRSRFGRHELANLVTLCHFHHRAVHHRGWLLHGDANRTLTFTAPDGRVATERITASAVPTGALHDTQVARGYSPGPATIGSAFGERLDRRWAVDVICGNQEIHERRN